MMRAFRALFFTLFALALGVQAMIMLERGDFVFITLGQCLALFYWPDPTGASAWLDSVVKNAVVVERGLAMPALIVFGAPWLLLHGLARKRRR